VAADQTDGLRLSFDSGDVVHLRPSGNAPELRVYTESDTPEAPPPQRTRR
jgi:phosphomannomutase